MRTKYTDTGLWIDQVGENYRIGLSEKGQDDVGEVMYIDLPEFGEEIAVSDTLIGLEGAKAVTEIVAPISGKVEKVNENLENDYSLLNSKNPEDNWIIELSDVLGVNSAEFSEDPWFGQTPPEEEE